MKLYEISTQYREAMNVLADMDFGEISEEDRRQMIADTLGGIESEFRIKALNIGTFIANLDIEADALKTMEERLQQRRKAAERKSAWLTNYLHQAMEHLGFGEIKDLEYPVRLKLKKSPPKVVVEDETLIPNDYTETRVEVLVRKTLIADALKSGIAVPGAHLEAGTRLEIR